jgi:hypothetical protein
VVYECKIKDNESNKPLKMHFGSKHFMNVQVSTVTSPYLSHTHTISSEKSAVL